MEMTRYFDAQFQETPLYMRQFDLYIHFILYNSPLLFTEFADIPCRFVDIPDAPTIDA